MAQKPELIVFGQYALGGVLSFYEYLLGFDDKGIFDKHVILLNVQESDHAVPTLNFPNATTRIFNYSRNETPYEYGKRLRALISDRPGAILSCFYPELVALHIRRCRAKTLFYICHDELYYKRAADYSFLIDVYISHNPAISEELQKRIPRRKKDIRYIPYGVERAPSPRRAEPERPLRLVFLGRHVAKKGIFDLPLIIRSLQELGIPTTWTIFGEGAETKKLHEIMNEFENVEFKRYNSRGELFSVLKNRDVIVHPSYLDGLPVAILEGMSAGLVPITYAFNAGIEMVLGDDAGIVVPVGDVHGLSHSIAKLHHNRQLLDRYSVAARRLVETHYDGTKQASEWYELLSRFEELKKPQRFKLINYHSRWSNHPFVPPSLRSVLIGCEDYVRRSLKRSRLSGGPKSR